MMNVINVHKFYVFNTHNIKRITNAQFSLYTLVMILVTVIYKPEDISYVISKK